MLITNGLLHYDLYSCMRLSKVGIFLFRFRMTCMVVERGRRSNSAIIDDLLSLEHNQVRI